MTANRMLLDVMTKFDLDEFYSVSFSCKYVHEAKLQGESETLLKKFEDMGYKFNQNHKNRNNFLYCDLQFEGYKLTIVLT